MNEFNNNQVNGAYNPYAAPQQPQQPAYQQPQQPAYQQPQQPVYQQPVYQQPQQPAYDPYAQQGYNQPAYGQPEAVNDTATLIFGIVALVCACTFYLAIGGIIFGALARSKHASLSQQYGNIGGTVKTGKILGTIGFVLGIVLTAILFTILLFGL